MRTHVRALPLVALVVVPAIFAMGACNEPDEPLHHAALSRSITQPIVGGQLESGLDATMAMTVDTGSGLAPICSGTMIGKNGTNGYVLTAAHCGNIDFVLQADTYAACDQGAGPNCRFYQVVESQIHPSYNADPAYDFQMLRVVGVDAQTPVIPASSGDNIQNGTPITLAGYGQINTGNGLGDTSGRRSATNTVEAFDGLAIYFTQSYTQGNGGVCFGDSGGPTFATSGGQLEVVGVNQAVTSDFCDDVGISGRVQAVYGSFIGPFMGEDPGQLTCDQCFQIEVNSSGGQCADEVGTCFNDATCAALADCVAGCGNQSCINDCAAANASGIPLYNAIFECWCTACDTECATECADPTTTAAGPGPTTDVGVGPSSTNAGAGVTTGEGVTTGGVTVGTGAGAGSSTGTDGTGVATGSGTETAAGAGGANNGSGGASGSEGGGKGDGDGEGSTASGDDGCSVGAAGAPARSGLWAIGLAGLAFAAASRRRRA